MPDKSPSSQDTRRFDNRHILTGAAAVLLLWFAVSNWQSVEIHFWVSSSRAPLFIVVLVAAALGGVVTRLAARRRKPSRHSSD
jgi:uncharacterized integral membrane protein